MFLSGYVSNLDHQLLVQVYVKLFMVVILSDTYTDQTKELNLETLGMDKCFFIVMPTTHKVEVVVDLAVLEDLEDLEELAE